MPRQRGRQTETRAVLAEQDQRDGEDVAARRVPQVGPAEHEGDASRGQAQTGMAARAAMRSLAKAGLVATRAVSAEPDQQSEEDTARRVLYPEGEFGASGSSGKRLAASRVQLHASVAAADNGTGQGLKAGARARAARLALARAVLPHRTDELQPRRATSLANASARRKRSEESAAPHQSSSVPEPTQGAAQEGVGTPHRAGRQAAETDAVEQVPDETILKESSDVSVSSSEAPGVVQSSSNSSCGSTTAGVDAEVTIVSELAETYNKRIEEGEHGVASIGDQGPDANLSAFYTPQGAAGGVRVQENSAPEESSAGAMSGKDLHDLIALMQIQAAEIATQSQVLRKHEESLKLLPSYSDLLTKHEAQLATHSRILEQYGPRLEGFVQTQERVADLLKSRENQNGLMAQLVRFFPTVWTQYKSASREEGLPGGADYVQSLETCAAEGKGMLKPGRDLLHELDERRIEVAQVAGECEAIRARVQALDEHSVSSQTHIRDVETHVGQLQNDLTEVRENAECERRKLQSATDRLAAVCKKVSEGLTQVATGANELRVDVSQFDSLLSRLETLEGTFIERSRSALAPTLEQLFARVEGFQSVLDEQLTNDQWENIQRQDGQIRGLQTELAEVRLLCQTLQVSHNALAMSPTPSPLQAQIGAPFTPFQVAPFPSPMQQPTMIPLAWPQQQFLLQELQQACAGAHERLNSVSTRQREQEQIQGEMDVAIGDCAESLLAVDRRLAAIEHRTSRGPASLESGETEVSLISTGRESAVHAREMVELRCRIEELRSSRTSSRSDPEFVAVREEVTDLSQGMDSLWKTGRSQHKEVQTRLEEVREDVQEVAHKVQLLQQRLRDEAMRSWWTEQFDASGVMARLEQMTAVQNGTDLPTDSEAPAFGECFESLLAKAVAEGKVLDPPLFYSALNEELRADWDVYARRIYGQLRTEFRSGITEAMLEVCQLKDEVFPGWREEVFPAETKVQGNASAVHFSGVAELETDAVSANENIQEDSTDKASTDTPEGNEEIRAGSGIESKVTENSITVPDGREYSSLARQREEMRTERHRTLTLDVESEVREEPIPTAAGRGRSELAGQTEALRAERHRGLTDDMATWKIKPGGADTTPWRPGESLSTFANRQGPTAGGARGRYRGGVRGAAWGQEPEASRAAGSYRGRAPAGRPSFGRGAEDGQRRSHYGPELTSRTDFASRRGSQERMGMARDAAGCEESLLPDTSNVLGPQSFGNSLASPFRHPHMSVLPPASDISTHLSAGIVLSYYFEHKNDRFYKKSEQDEFSTEQKTNKVVLAEEEYWHGDTTRMAFVSSGNVEKQGVFQLLDRLENKFYMYNVVLQRQRLQLLYESFSKVQHHMDNLRKLIEMQSAAAGAQHQGLRWREIRRIVLDNFAPADWWPQTLALWRASMTQGPRPGHIWLTEYCHWSAVIQRCLPGNQRAIAPEFEAVMLRGGVSSRCDEALRTRAFNFDVYDHGQVMQNILEVCHHHSDGLGETKQSKAEVRRSAAESSARETLATELGFTDLAHLSTSTGSTVEAVLKAVRADKELEAACKRVAYTGAMADMLHGKGVTEADFKERMRQGQCVLCGSPDHRLYTCPGYSQSLMDELKANTQQQTQARWAHDRAQYAGREQYWQEKAKRAQEVAKNRQEQINSLTRSGHNREFQQRFTPNQAPAATAGGDGALKAVKKQARSARDTRRSARSERAAPASVREAREAHSDLSSVSSASSDESAEWLYQMGELGNGGPGSPHRS